MWLCLLCDNWATGVILRLFRLLQLGSHSTPTYSGSAFHSRYQCAARRISLHTSLRAQMSLFLVKCCQFPSPTELSVHVSLYLCVLLSMCVAVDDVWVHTGVVVLYAKHAPVTKALLHIRREICSANESKQTCICKNMCPWSVRHCFSVYVRGLARLIKASMGWCTLSQASVTGQTTSAAGQPSAPIVSEAQHSPARMAGLVKAVPFPPLFSSIPPSMGQNDFLISQKGQQKWSIKLEKGSISRLIFENGR